MSLETVLWGMFALFTICWVMYAYSMLLDWIERRKATPKSCFRMTETEMNPPQMKSLQERLALARVKPLRLSLTDAEMQAIRSAMGTEAASWGPFNTLESLKRSEPELRQQACADGVGGSQSPNVLKLKRAS